MITPSIIVNNINVHQYGKTILHNISFHLASNQHLAITGKTGSGKTVLAKAIANNIFYAGTIQINFTPNQLLLPKVTLVENSEKWKTLSNISNFYYQQRFNSCDATDTITVAEALSTINSIASSKEKKTLTNYWLQQFNLSDRINTPLIQLSNGEQKKLQLIKILIQQPQVLILDNAFNGLDINSRKELHAALNSIAQNGTTIIVVGNTKELPNCITHIAEIQEGNLIRYTEKANYASTHFKYRENISLNKPVPQIAFQETAATVLAMKNVSVKYGEKIILNSINWKILSGERWLLKGANGAGKSTLLSLITADNPQAYANEIYLFDKRRGKGESIWDIKKKIGYVSPELHKYFDTNITVYQTIASGFFDTMGLYKNLNASQEEILHNWMNFFELKKYANNLLHTLSVGQQRWVLLARALVKHPLLLVLDEPCQGLDDEHIAYFIELIDAICYASNTSLIYVSHYDEEIPSCIQFKMELINGKQTLQKKLQKVIAA